jgi:hypothetical protein
MDFNCENIDNYETLKADNQKIPIEKTVQQTIKKIFQEVHHKIQLQIKRVISI